MIVGEAVGSIGDERAVTNPSEILRPVPKANVGQCQGIVDDQSCFRKFQQGSMIRLLQIIGENTPGSHRHQEPRQTRGVTKGLSGQDVEYRLAQRFGWI